MAGDNFGSSAEYANPQIDELYADRFDEGEDSTTDHGGKISAATRNLSHQLDYLDKATVSLGEKLSAVLIPNSSSAKVSVGSKETTKEDRSEVAQTIDRMSARVRTITDHIELLQNRVDI